MYNQISVKDYIIHIRLVSQILLGAHGVFGVFLQLHPSIHGLQCISGSCGSWSQSPRVDQMTNSRRVAALNPRLGRSS